MKFRFVALLFAIAMLGGCGNGNNILEVTASGYSVDYDQNEITLSITASDSWSIDIDQDWCMATPSSGSGDREVTVTINANLTTQSRSANIYITSSNVDIVTITIEQSGSPESGYFYQLPVVFHTLYSDASDPNQYITAERLAEVVDYCNQIYSQEGNDMNFELVLATEDPDGNELDEPGVDRVYMLNSVYDEADFLSSEDSSLNSLIVWDCNSYINIYTYTFTTSSHLGISILAYTNQDDPLEGLVVGTPYYQYNDPSYVHGVHLNNTYAYVDASANYNSTDFKSTMAHELGHYLGLYHPFSESDCSETDYCDDTPNYNYELYTEELTELVKSSKNLTFYDLTLRTACDGAQFSATNIMDYDYCYFSGFTADQKTRVRHVLENSPLIPGPKNEGTKGSADDNTIPTPIVMRCDHHDSPCNHTKLFYFDATTLLGTSLGSI